MHVIPKGSEVRTNILPVPLHLRRTRRSILRQNRQIKGGLNINHNSLVGRIHVEREIQWERSGIVVQSSVDGEYGRVGSHVCDRGLSETGEKLDDIAGSHSSCNW